MSAKSKVKEWTPNQLKRLPDAGYWLHRYHIGGEARYTAYCIMNGRIKYIRTDVPHPAWHTLLWSCMPTKKMISSEEQSGRWWHFQTNEAMKARFPFIDKSFFEKPDNDLSPSKPKIP